MTKTGCIQYPSICWEWIKKNTAEGSSARQFAKDAADYAVETLRQMGELAVKSSAAIAITATACIESIVCAPFIILLDAVRNLLLGKPYLLIEDWQKQCESAPVQKDWMIERSQMQRILDDKRKFYQFIERHQPEHIWSDVERFPDSISEGLPATHYFCDGEIYRCLHMVSLTISAETKEDLCSKLEAYARKHILIKNLVILFKANKFEVPLDEPILVALQVQTVVL